MAGWGDLFGKIAQQFQGRVERLKNEKIALKIELDGLQRGACTDQAAARASVIIKRISEIDGILGNKASD